MGEVWTAGGGRKEVAGSRVDVHAKATHTTHDSTHFDNMHTHTETCRHLKCSTYINTHILSSDALAAEGDTCNTVLKHTHHAPHGNTVRPKAVDEGLHALRPGLDLIGSHAGQKSKVVSV